MKVLLLMLLLCPAAMAEDAIVFVADEADLKAFDQMLSEQQEKFGQSVSEKAQQQGDAENKGALGKWVSEQRRSEKAGAKGNQRGRSGEVRGMVNEKANAANPNASSNRKKKK